MTKFYIILGITLTIYWIIFATKKAVDADSDFKMAVWFGSIFVVPLSIIILLLPI